MGIVSSQQVPPTQNQAPADATQQFTTPHHALRPSLPNSPSIAGSEIAVEPSIQGTKKACKSGSSRKRKRAMEDGLRVADALMEHSAEHVPKKKAKRAKAVTQPEDTMTSSAKTLAHVAIPTSANDANEAANVKTAKKRKQATGRPSGLSIAPLKEETGQKQVEPEVTPTVDLRDGASVDSRKEKRKRQEVSANDGLVTEERAQGIVANGPKQRPPPVSSFTAINSPTTQKAMVAINVPISADKTAASSVAVPGASKHRKKSKKRKHGGEEDELEHLSEAGPHQAIGKQKEVKYRRNPGDANLEVQQEEKDATQSEHGSQAKKRKTPHTNDQSSGRSHAVRKSPAPVEITSMAPQSARSSASPERNVARESPYSRPKDRAKSKSRVEPKQHKQGSLTGRPAEVAEEVAYTQHVVKNPVVRNWLSEGRSQYIESGRKNNRSEPNSCPQKPSKSVSQDSDDDGSQYQDEDGSHTNDEDTTQARARPSTAPGIYGHSSAAPRKSQYDGEDKGLFTATEKAIADEVFMDVCESENLTDHQLKVRIQNWTTCVVFKTALKDALPRRSQAALRKFAKMRYTPLERGSWSTEQDERLRAAHTENPGRWTIISEVVERPALDCKDRWVNHLKYGQKEIGAWSQVEETALAEAVKKCVKKIKKANKGDEALRNDRARLESLINWEAVAAELGGKRPARRCRIKWEKLKSRSSSTAQEPLDTTTILDEDEAGLSNKMRRAKKRYVRAKIGNKIEMLMEIYEVVNHDKIFNAESTLWSYVALANSTSEYDASMRRWNYYACLNASRPLLKQPNIAATALQLADELVDLHGDEACHDKADPAELKAQYQQDQAKKSKKFKKALAENVDSGNRSQSARRSARAAMLSNEYVEDSSDDEHESESGASRKENVETSTKKLSAGQQQKKMQTPTLAGQQEFASPLTISSMNSAWEDRKSPVLSREQFQARVKKRGGETTTR